MWWERKGWEESIKEGKLFKPFILKYVLMDGMRCSKCSWTEQCAGCVILPVDMPRIVSDLGSPKMRAIVVEWHSETLNEVYNQIVNEVIDHPSVKQQELDDAAVVNYTSIDDCLSKFHRTEVLENEMRCSKCADLTPHLKKMDIFRPPPVLVITLKRFRQVGNHWRKIEANVDFPIKNLDIK